MLALGPKEETRVGAHKLTGLGESDWGRETQRFSFTCVYPRISTCIHVGVYVFRIYMHVSAHMLTCTYAHR